MNVTSVSLTWAPYLTIGDCDDIGHNCKQVGCNLHNTHARDHNHINGGNIQNFGANVDTFTILGGMFNFSGFSTMDPNNDWGVYQKSGAGNLSHGVYAGAMGDVRTSRSITEPTCTRQCRHCFFNRWSMESTP